MTFKELIEKHPLINVAELARLMFPGKTDPKTRLNNKMNTRHRQRITEEDVATIKEKLTKQSEVLIKDLESLEHHPKPSKPSSSP